MTDKICVFCKHFWFTMGEPGYSEMTPGSDASIYCDKKHWRMGNYDGVVKYRKNILKAETCKDYEHQA